VRGSRRAVGLAAEGRGEKLPPRNGETPGWTAAAYGGSPRPLFPLNCLRPTFAFHG